LNLNLNLSLNFKSQNTAYPALEFEFEAYMYIARPKLTFIKLTKINIYIKKLADS